MGQDITSVGFIIFIDGFETTPRELTFLQLRAIAKEIKGVWESSQYPEIWFDVETEGINDFWHPKLKVSCYYRPGKNPAVIPDEYLRGLLNVKIQIFPKVGENLNINPVLKPFDFTGHIVEVMFGIE